MTPAVKAFVLAAFAQFEARIAALEEQVKQLSAKTPKATPKNSGKLRWGQGSCAEGKLRWGQTCSSVFVREG